MADRNDLFLDSIRVRALNSLGTSSGPRYMDLYVSELQENSHNEKARMLTDVLKKVSASDLYVLQITLFTPLT